MKSPTKQGKEARTGIKLCRSIHTHNTNTFVNSQAQLYLSADVTTATLFLALPLQNQ